MCVTGPERVRGEIVVGQVEDEQVEAVIIATADEFHIPLAQQAIAAGKHVFTEKPIAESVADGQELADAAAAAGIIDGVVHDKLYLPGLRKLERLIRSGFFGRILSVRGEFGYWVFEGDLTAAQRPSWNYRSEDGGGIVLDMFCHWDYVLTNLFGRSRR